MKYEIDIERGAKKLEELKKPLGLVDYRWMLEQIKDCVKLVEVGVSRADSSPSAKKEQK